MESRMRKAENNRGGFTLVEMIVVIVILAIVAAITVPAFTKYIDSNKEKQCVIYRKSLVSRLEEARVTNRNAVMSDVIAKYTDLTCPAGGVYTAKDANTVQCDLHGETATIGSGIGDVAMNTPGNAKPNTGQGTSGGGNTGPTEKEEPDTEPSTEPKQTETTPTEAVTEKETETEKKGNVGISSGGTTFTIDDMVLQAGTWANFRGKVNDLQNDWNYIYFSYPGNQRIFTEGDKLYIAGGYSRIFKSNITESITIAEYNEKASDVDRFYEVKTGNVFYYDEMSDTQKETVAEVGTVLYYNGNYYVAFSSDRKYNQVQYSTDSTDNGWWKIRKDDSEYRTQITVAESQVNVLDSSKIAAADVNSEVWLDPGTMLSYNGELYVNSNTVKISGGTKAENYIGAYIKVNLLDIKDYQTVYDSNQQWTNASKGTTMLYNGKYYVAVNDWSQYGGVTSLNGWVLLQ